jgi:MoaA/NifB/PqqE/SkfB family radical SAM enzyme
MKFTRSFSAIQDNNKLFGLVAIELNITELCNRVCSFCPRHDPKLYPNRNLNMSFDTVNILLSQLKNASFGGYIGLCGYGEPTLHPQFLDIAKLLSGYKLEVITNGDSILKNKLSIDEIYNAGVDKLLISDYDRNPIWEDYTKKYPDLIVRDRYDDGSDVYEEYDFNNRGGTLWELNKSNNSPCYLPSYKTIIDWNGDLVLCCNNWINKKVFGNIHSSSISDIWMSDELTHYRKELLKGNRHSLIPCNNCNVKGTLLGKEQAQLWIEKEN